MHLLDAVKNGFYYEVERCLQENQSVSMTDVSGFTPLHWAAFYGHTDIIELLIQHRAIVDQPATKFNATPLHIAANRNQAEAIQKLLTCGANLERETQNHQTPLELAARVGKNFEAVIALLEAGATVRNKGTLTNTVIRSLMQNQVECLQTCLEKGEYRLTQINQMGKNTDSNNSIGNVDELTTGFQATTLIAACNFSHDCLRYLLTKNPHSLTPHPLSISRELNLNLFFWLTQNLPHKKIFMAPFEFLEKQRQIEITKTEDLLKILPSCLLDQPCTFEYDKKEDMIYISEVQCDLVYLKFNPDGTLANKEKIVEKMKLTLEFLKSRDLDMNHCKLLGKDALIFLMNCPYEIIHVFHEMGAKFSGQDLQAAIRDQTPDVVELLIKNGASVLWKDEQGQNAIELLKTVDNDLLLNDRYNLMMQMEEKAKIEMLHPIEPDYEIGNEPDPALLYFQRLLEQSSRRPASPEGKPMECETTSPQTERKRPGNF